MCLPLRRKGQRTHRQQTATQPPTDRLRPWAATPAGPPRDAAAAHPRSGYGSAELPNSSYSWSGIGFPYLMLLARRSPAISESWISGRNSFRPCEDLQMSRPRLAYVAIRPVVVVVGAAAGKSRWCAGCAQGESSKGSSHQRLVSGGRAGNWVDAAARRGTRQRTVSAQHQVQTHLVTLRRRLC